MIVAGGNATTANLISHGVMLLDGDHRQREQLVADPALVPNELMEFLRLEGSVQGLARTTTRAVRLHDTEVPAGEKVLLLYAAANRDEREFGPTAEVLDIRREMPRHLGFASGPTSASAATSRSSRPAWRWRSCTHGSRTWGWT